MKLLEYTSKEMFSSTELIRKSKMVFDKVATNEIDKAIILRDGKPSFIMMEFSKYEEIMAEYIQLKERQKNKPQTAINEVKQVIKENIETLSDDEIENIDEINDEDLKEALAKIDQMDIDLNSEIKVEEKEPLKEFWE